MAKRQRLTLEEVLDDVMDNDYDDPDEPVMDRSDDDFDDLEIGERELDDLSPSHTPSHSSPNSPFSPTHSLASSPVSHCLTCINQPSPPSLPTTPTLSSGESSHSFQGTCMHMHVCTFVTHNKILNYNQLIFFLSCDTTLYT